MYYPTSRGYSGYSKELDGIRSEGKAIEELFEGIKKLLEVRISSLKEIGKEKEAKDLKESEIVFVED